VVVVDYYPSWYWVQPNHYPPPPPTRNKWLPWIVIFLLIIGSFYTIYLYIQPEFVIDKVTCTRNYVIAHLITSKAGRVFMGSFEMEIGKARYVKKVSASVEEGKSIDVVFTVSLAPGKYEGILYFRSQPIGSFSCEVR